MLKGVCEQYLCVFCDNFAVANYTLGRDGIKPETVRIPECQSCDRLACYVCWRRNLLHGDRKCPNCNDETKISDRELELLKKQIDDNGTWDENQSLLDIDDYMNFCTKRPLKNILFQLRVVHRCPDKEEWALKTAEKLWEDNFRELCNASGRRATLNAALQKITEEHDKSLEPVDERDIDESASR